METYKKSSKQVAQALNTHIEQGITNKEATLRLKMYGTNTLTEKREKSMVYIFFEQFLNPLIFVLLGAAVASLIIKDINDALIISITAFLNAILGFIQEWKAEKIAQKLKSYEVFYATVMRDGKKERIPTGNVVPGDIVFIEAGDKVPADIRLVDMIDLVADESLLTGEAEPIKKSTEVIQETSVIGDQKNTLFLGTIILKGKGHGIVIATGTKTELGKIAHLITKESSGLTPIQTQLKRFSTFITILVLFVVSTVFSIGIIRNMFSSLPVHSLKDLISISIALAVASIPEGLLIGVTVVLSVGMQRMLRRKALVKKLVAAEGLGSVSVICTDKTGTLTEGKLSTSVIATAREITAVKNHISKDIRDILELATLNNDASIDKNRVGDPLEIALLETATSIGIDIHATKQEYPRIKEIPFSSERKFMATVHTKDNQERLIVKGAPETVLDMCNLSPEDRNSLQEKQTSMVDQGLRILAIAYKDKKNIRLDEDLLELTFGAIFGLQDSLRDTAVHTIQALNAAGIRTVLVTGDHKKTALYIARGAGIVATPEMVITGTELSTISDEELPRIISKYSVIARVDPEHKIRVVNAWKKGNNFVAMIGDGVNDAPAIRAADIGVALGSGADITHEIADIILLDNNLATIQAAVYEGRIIFDNIKKIAGYLLTDSFSEIVLIGTAILFNFASPLTALQIIWINLMSDGPAFMALAFEPEEIGIREEKPRAFGEPIIDSYMKFLIFGIGIITDIGLLILFLYHLNLGYPLIHCQTIIFTALALDSLLYVFSIRTLRSSIFRTNPFINKWLLPACIFGLATQLTVVYIPFLQKLFGTVPLSLYDWMFIIPLSFIKFIAIELTKDIYLRYIKK